MMTQGEWDRLLDRQRELEESAFTEGAQQFRRRLTEAEQGGRASRIGGAKKLLREGVGKMEIAIQAMIDAPAGRGKGRRHVAAKWCKLVGPDVAAYMTLKVVLDGIGKRQEMRQTAAVVAGLLFDELRYRRFRREAPHLFDYKLKSFHTSSYSHMARSLNASMRFAEIDTSDLQLPPSQMLLIGVKLIDVLIEATELVSVKHTITPGRRAKTTITLEPTVETRRWLDRYNAAVEMWQPIVMPMVVPPLRWGPEEIGGYRFALRNKFGLVRKISKPMQLTVAQEAGPVVYEAVNGLQNTAWRINRPLLAAVEAIKEAGGGLAGLPMSEDERLPAKPVDIEENAEARKAWRKLAHAARERNNVRRQRSVGLLKVLAVASGLKTERAIFFPYSLDFRGRLYPVATYLTPQGDDLSRALLTFADGKALDGDGLRWLAVHGANCMGKLADGTRVSRMTLEERWAWVITNSSRIVASADRPLEEGWWADADDPLQFLAFCFEWTNLLRANERGEEYVCSLPVSMDGTCNGIQHFSALLCDEVGGASVNVVPQDRPQDIYDSVAGAVLRRVEQLAPSDPVAALWLGLHVKLGMIDRGLTKRPTMTFGYGSKQHGFKSQIKQYLKEHQDSAHIRQHFTIDKASQLAAACALMARLIWESLGEAVVAAFEGMDWMQRATRGIAKRGQPVSWRVPGTGFPVQQDYYHTTKQQVTTILAGHTVRPAVWHETDKVNGRKQSNAIAPNFIHSLDAAALMLTVELAAMEGIEQFAMVHDSYGTLPTDCSLLARCCRQAFAKLYMQQDVVGLLHGQLAAQWEHPEKCPAPPAKGTLDVSQVLGSTYFFT